MGSAARAIAFGRRSVPRRPRDAAVRPCAAAGVSERASVGTELGAPPLRRRCHRPAALDGFSADAARNPAARRRADADVSRCQSGRRRCGRTTRIRWRSSMRPNGWLRRCMRPWPIRCSSSSSRCSTLRLRASARWCDGSGGRSWHPASSSTGTRRSARSSSRAHRVRAPHARGSRAPPCSTASAGRSSRSTSPASAIGRADTGIRCSPTTWWRQPESCRRAPPKSSGCSNAAVSGPVARRPG